MAATFAGNLQSAYISIPRNRCNGYLALCASPYALPKLQTGYWQC